MPSAPRGAGGARGAPRNSPQRQRAARLRRRAGRFWHRRRQREGGARGGRGAVGRRYPGTLCAGRGDAAARAPSAPGTRSADSQRGPGVRLPPRAAPRPAVPPLTHAPASPAARRQVPVAQRPGAGGAAARRSPLPLRAGARLGARRAISRAGPHLGIPGRRAALETPGGRSPAPPRQPGHGPPRGAPRDGAAGGHGAARGSVAGLLLTRTLRGPG